LETAPEIMEFASGKLIEVFMKKMKNLEKTVSKAEDKAENLNFYEIDNQILSVIKPHFESISKTGDLPETFSLNQLVQESECLTSTKEREFYNPASDCLPDVFMRLCPIDLVQTFSDEYKDDIDDNISVYSGLTMETEMTLAEKEEKSSKILSVFSKMHNFYQSLKSRTGVSTKIKLGMLVIAAACLEYGEFMLDFDNFMQKVKFDDDEVDVEELEREIMVERTYTRLGVFCNLKTVSAELKKAFINSLIKNKEYNIILRCDKFDNGFYSLLKEYVFEHQDFLKNCVEAEIKLKHWDRIAKFVNFIQQNDVAVNEETSTILKECLEQNKQAGLKVLNLYPHQFYMFQDYYQDDAYKVKVMNIILTNVVEIYSMNTNETYWTPSLCLKKFLIFAMNNMKTFFTWDLDQDIQQQLKYRKRIFLDHQSIIRKMGKTFKHAWNNTIITGDQEKYTSVQKLFVTFSSEIEVSQNFTIFDYIYFIGKNARLMDFLFGSESATNWYSVIYSSDMEIGSKSAEEISQRIRFLDFMTQPLGQWIDSQD
jgi:hypothetical protein